jgi:hypothetical protein
MGPFLPQKKCGDGAGVTLNSALMQQKAIILRIVGVEIVITSQNRLTLQF